MSIANQLRPAPPVDHPTIEPVVIEQVRKCQFKAKPCRTCGLPPSNPVHRKKDGTCKLRRALGCANCGKNKGDFDHYGAPQSLNILGSGNPKVYTYLKQQWEEILGQLLIESGLPKGLELVMVDGEVTFPDRQARDEGNLRFLVEKALGDTLVAGGWLEADTFFPVRHYTFGTLAARYEPGVSAIRLVLWPG